VPAGPARHVLGRSRHTTDGVEAQLGAIAGPRHACCYPEPWPTQHMPRASAQWRLAGLPAPAVMVIGGPSLRALLRACWLHWCVISHPKSPWPPARRPAAGCLWAALIDLGAAARATSLAHLIAGGSCCCCSCIVQGLFKPLLRPPRHTPPHSVQQRPPPHTRTHSSTHAYERALSARLHVSHQRRLR
jgi:hypothetical protein